MRQQAVATRVQEQQRGGALFAAAAFHPAAATSSTITPQTQGFKAYRGHVKVGPLADDLVCVVGPNGVGKSNIVSWLLAWIQCGGGYMLRFERERR